MKYFIITISLFSQFSFANDTIDIQNMLQSSRCIPHRAEDGTVTTFKCDGPMGELMKAKKMKFEAGDVLGEAVHVEQIPQVQ